MELSKIIDLPLKITIDGKEYTLRYFNLEDNVWLKEVIKEDNYKKLFNSESIDCDHLGKIIYHQIENKEDFKQTEIVEIDLDGNEVKKKVGGYKKFLNMIGAENINKLLYVFYELHFKSQTEDEEADKKKVEDLILKYVKIPKKTGKK